MAIISTSEAPKPPIVIIAAPYAPAGPILAGTSNSEMDVGTSGTYAFHMNETALGFVPGIRARASAAVDPTTWIEGIIVTYNLVTNTIFIASDYSNGYGIYNDWNLNVAGERGQKGDKGDTGAPGPPGPMTGASLTSPVFVGDPTCPTAAVNDNDFSLANTAFVTRAIANAKVSPVFTGTPTAVTAALGTNSLQLATTQFVKTAIDNIGTVGGFAPLASPNFTGDPKAPTPAPGDADTSISTTAFVADAINTAVTALKGGASTSGDTLGELEALVNANSAALAGKANIASPNLTGTPTAPTQPNADNGITLATTAFVHNVVVSVPGGGNVSNVGTPTLNQLAFWTTANTIEGRDPVVALTAVGIAPLANPTFSGTVAAPTTSPATKNDMTVATTAFVQAAITAALAGGGFTTGDMKPTVKTVADPGWALLNDGTIGDATSGGTNRANADCQPLFTLLWTNISNTYAPVLPGGRGASAAADWAAHKTIALPKALGRVLGVAGLAGAGLTARSLGQTIGEELHSWVGAELIQHSHTVYDPTHYHVFQGYQALIQASYTTVDPGGSYNVCLWGGGLANTSAASTATSTTATGSSTPANVMQPSLFVMWMIKL